MLEREGDVIAHREYRDLLEEAGSCEAAVAEHRQRSLDDNPVLGALTLD